MFLKRKEHNSIPIFIAIGANLSNERGETPLTICERAAHDIASIGGMLGAIRSRWFSTAPIPASDQPRYINGVLALRGDIAPDALLHALHAIELRAGRVRAERNAARTLDLDIIAIGSLVRDAPDPILPHPRAHQRAFVLLPLRDLAPDWVHPVLGTPIESLIAALPSQDIRPVCGQD